MAIAYDSRVVRLVDYSSGQELATLAAPRELHIRALSFNPEGSQLAVAALARVVQVWDLRAIRAALARMRLDWDGPSYPPERQQSTDPPIRVTSIVSP